MAGDKISVAEYRAQVGQPKQPATGPTAPRHVKGKPQWALGRLPTGTMNKTEERYLAEVITPLMMAGDLVWWCFEGIKLRLADNTFLTVDFAQMRSDGTLELVDVKGSRAMVEDDAWVKLKVAKSKFPFRFFMALPGRNGWRIEEV